MDKDTIKRLIIEYQQFVVDIRLTEREIHLSHPVQLCLRGNSHCNWETPSDVPTNTKLVELWNINQKKSPFQL